MTQHYYDTTQNAPMTAGGNVHDADTNTNQSTAPSWLGDLYHWFINCFVYAPELKVRQKLDRNGNERWYIYNPSTNQSAQFTSEMEVRIWLEQSYRQ